MLIGAGVVLQAGTGVGFVASLAAAAAFDLRSSPTAEEEEREEEEGEHVHSGTTDGSTDRTGGDNGGNGSGFWRGTLGALR